MSGNPQLIEEMRWQLRQIEERKADNQRLLAGIAGSEHTTVTSPDRSVTVLAGPGGVVSEVRLAPEAMRFDAITLSRTITAAIREAVSAGRPLAQPPAPQAPPAPPQRPRRQNPADDDEPYDTVFDV
ncbi:YbaB/EbfC family nucleoid-associated protein [Amycolatopsis sp. FBCC-B4732]|uniref:YbaB/EbfC family nucleoid-associated protein n=1 Tax=Amycolatopsis sp. FBCC-B4732 TaxID=3079339 RepID=UPI001FF2FE9C|nr:YbaB/EbfC family nucleoid-associated protein [Amycolatopsis sp. FBCC-B4732]UOX87641.1 YbaB/EbfC family nucleoid-associated protein [Amycolatopsis sp. FBCC-B4732]